MVNWAINEKMIVRKGKEVVLRVHALKEAR